MIWVIGCKGMLGTELAFFLEKSGLPFTGTGREIDITDQNALMNFCKYKSFNWIINCAAYTAVDKAEVETDLCRLINTYGSGNIAVCAKEINARLIHISTDYVFDGMGSFGNEEFRPYREDDQTNPVSIYGLSKRDGENIVLENNPASYIIRTSWLYGKYGVNFVRTLQRLMDEQRVIRVINDKYGCPTWSFDLAFTIAEFIKQTDSGRTIPYGIYHYSNEGGISWFDLASEIYLQSRALGILENDCNVLPCTSAEYPQRARRPVYSVLNKSKVKKTLGIEIPIWNNSLKNYLKTVDAVQ